MSPPARPVDGPRFWEDYFHAHIPLSQKMGLQVEVATPECVQLAFPLAPNLNHQQTVFGGSLSAACTLAGWLLVRLKAQQAAPGASLQVVIAENTVHYRHPVSSAFKTRAGAEETSANDWNRFSKCLVERARAAVWVTAQVGIPGMEWTAFRGRFAVAVT